MRRTLSQPNLAAVSQTNADHPLASPRDVTLLLRFNNDHAGHPAHVLIPPTAPSPTHGPQPPHPSRHNSVPDTSFDGPGGAAAYVRSTRRSQSFKCLGPTTSLHPNSHCAKPNCLPPRAVMRSFLSAQGHMSSAGRLARPACGVSSTCPSLMAGTDTSAGASDLSNDLRHALERQGRNSADVASSSNLAHSRHSMDTDGLAATPPPCAGLPSCMLTFAAAASLHNSFGSCTSSIAARTDDDHSGPLHTPSAGADRGSSECCTAHAPGSAGRGCDDSICSGAAAPTAAAATAAAAAGTRSSLRASNLRRVLAAEAALAAPAAAPAAAGAQRVHDALRRCHPDVRASALAMAMSSALFRPVMLSVPAASNLSSDTAAPPPAPAGDSNSSCAESVLGAVRCGSAAGMDSEGRPSMDSAFEVELLMRVARARQTMDFAARQRARFGSLRIAELPLWDALRLLDSLPPSPETADAELSPLRHALLCAQWCAHELPQFDWAPLVGLMHSLGRLLSHNRFGGEPAWAVTSETYPLGCRFSEAISGHDFLTACPDRRCSSYATPNGIYAARCGYDAMHFTWTAAEYLSHVVAGSGTRLPFAAAFLLRYQGFESAIAGGAYLHLASAADEVCMPTLRKFAAIRRAATAGLLEEPPGGPSQQEVAERCSRLFEYYFPAGVLRF
eukprot:jgi/Ulvmu1/6543/UM003_0177.1